MSERIGAELIDFGLRWAPFGGPCDDDLLVEFGMTSGTYYNRLARALRMRPAVQGGEAAHRSLLDMCYRQEPRSGGFEASTSDPPTPTTSTSPSK
ncbi:hypothetical protein ROP_05250 [Rhodococcus opacus B4]|uniref:DUF3263 domain-containing protein n=1 Tax=Rhodococcus opacus (strain B4) TaxID=632772 RepID=C1ARU5_RHOOB|nr:hypothetical protein ROP_05250 [Rhodococcus opacus B4]